MIGTLERAVAPSRSASAQTPPTIPALPLQPGKLYLRLYHGRATPDEQMEDWGSDGPVIGPLASIHVTYMPSEIHRSPGRHGTLFPGGHGAVASQRCQ
jgi:hypothetical protein